MKFRKTEKAKWTIVHYAKDGKRMRAEFVNGEFETSDEFVICRLKEMGYESIGKLPEKPKQEPEKVVDESPKIKPGRRSKKD